MNRTKKKVTTIINSDEVPEQVRNFATATSEIKKIEAEIEIEKQSIIKRFETRLQKLNDLRDDAFENLQHWAEANPDQFTKAKSIDYPNGKIGFRLGTPKVEKSKKLTWDGVVDQLKTIAPDYVRVKEEVNKELVITMWENKDVNPKLSQAGLNVTQDETFFVVAKEEDLILN